MSKSVNIILKADGKMAHKALDALTAKLEALSGTVGKVGSKISNQMSSMSSRVSAKMVTLGSLLASIVQKTVGKIIDLLKGAEDAYANVLSARVRLAQAMSNSGATQAEYNEVTKLIDAETRLGVVSQQAQLNGAQKLATYVKETDALKKLIPAMNDLTVAHYGLSATEENTYATAQQLGRALQGNTRIFTELGIQLSESQKDLFTYGSEEQRVAELTRIVSERVGDMNHTLAQTDAGKQVQLANSFAMLRAQLGEIITTVKAMFLPALARVVGWLGKIIGYIKAVLALFGKKVATGATNASKAISGVGDAVGDYGNSAQKAAKQVKGALASFDEMNTLQDNSASADTSGAGYDVGTGIAGGIEDAVEAIDWGSIIPDIKLPKWLEKLIGFLKDIAPLVLKVAGAFGIYEVAAGAVNGVLGNFVDKGLKTFTGLGSKAGAITDKMTGAFKTLFGVVQAHPFLTLTAVIGGLLLTNENFRDFLKDFLQNTLQKLMDFVKRIGEALKPLVQVLKELGEKIIKRVMDTIERLRPVIEKVFTVFEKVLSKILDFVGKLIAKIAEKLLPIFEKLSPIFEKIFDFIMDILDIAIDLLDQIMDPLMELVDVLMDLLEPVLELISEVLDAVMPILEVILDLVEDILDFAMPYLKDIAKFIADVLVVAIKVVIEVLKVVIAIVKSIVEVVVDVITAIVQVISDFVTRVVQVVTDIWNAIEEILVQLLDFFKGIIWGIWNAVKEGLRIIRDLLVDAWNGVKDFFASVPTYFKEKFERASNNIKNAFASIPQFFSNLWDKIKTKFGEIGTKIGETVSGAFKGVVNGILSFAESFLNTPIRGINRLIDVINKVPGINLGYLNTLSFPRLARGGIINDATIAMVGESGREAVVPLENNTEWIDELADRIGSKDEGNPVFIVRIGDEEITDVMVEKINEKSYNRNRSVIA